MAGISLEKVQREAPALVDLYKKSGDVVLEKGLTGETAAVSAIVDHSGSMSWLYANGFVQSAVERVLAASFHFDDDGKVPVVLFDYKAHKPFDVTIQNYLGAIRRGRMGSTNYADAMRKALDVHKKEIKKGKPAFVVFFTDGEPDSRREAEKVIRESAGLPVFWQFIGVGGHNFPFLEQLDNLTGRVIDNAGFFVYRDGMDDTTLYREMMKEFPSWLANARRQGIIR